MMRDTHWLLITRSKQILPYNQRQVIAQKITLNAKGDEKIVTLQDQKQIWEESRHYSIGYLANFVQEWKSKLLKKELLPRG